MPAVPRRARLSALAVVAPLLFGCGGAQKPSASSPDTSSLEHEKSEGAGSEGASSPSPAGGSNDSSSASSSSTSPSSTKSSASSGSGGAKGAAKDTDSTGSSAAPAGAAAVHPTPSATGNIDGKPFAPKIGRATAAMQKDGRLLVTLTEGTECGATPKPGEGALSVLIEWKDGYKTDVGSLRRATKPGGRGVGCTRGGAVSQTFKPSGRSTGVSAPTDACSTAKLNLDVQR